MIRDLRLVFSGRVQGVGFRAETCALAKDYMIDGWVKNLSDGKVEILARGEDAEVMSFLHKIENSRLGAYIDTVEKSLQEPSAQILTGFMIVY